MKVEITTTITLEDGPTLTLTETEARSLWAQLNERFGKNALAPIETIPSWAPPSNPIWPNGPVVTYSQSNE